MADNMQELKEQKIWMLWRWETKPDGKRTKVSMSVTAVLAVQTISGTAYQNRIELHRRILTANYY